MPKQVAHYRFSTLADAQSMSDWVDGHLGYPDSVTDRYARIEEHPRQDDWAYPNTSVVASLVATHGLPAVASGAPLTPIPSWELTIAEHVEIFEVGPVQARLNRRARGVPLNAVAGGARL